MTRIVELKAQGATVRIAPALGGRVTQACLVGENGALLPVVHPYPESATNLLTWAKGGMFPLIPYSGRIGRARLNHDGSAVELVAHPGGEPHTLHGISQQRPWILDQASDRRAVLYYRHEPDAHWPWRFQANWEIGLEPQRLSIDIELSNADRRSMPAGIGGHPYLPYTEGASLSFEAGPAWPYDADFLGLPPVKGEVQAVTVSAARLAAGELTLFHGDWAGEVRLHHGDGSVLRVVAHRGLSHLVIHRPTAETPYVCIEPVSHVADGFNLHARGVSGTGTRILAPGESMRGRFEISTAQYRPDCVVSSSIRARQGENALGSCENRPCKQPRN